MIMQYFGGQQRRRQADADRHRKLRLDSNRIWIRNIGGEPHRPGRGTDAVT